jgi:ferrous iron transport protein B
LVQQVFSPSCLATIAITRSETSSWFWAAFQFVFLTVLAYIITFAVYQIGSLVVAL